jgi:hypothetical protein
MAPSDHGAREDPAMGTRQRPHAKLWALHATLLVAVLTASTGLAGTDLALARKSPGPREVLSFANTTALGMGDDAPAQSSQISVSGFDTLVADVEVTLVNINFGAASSQDMDVVLVGPGGQTAIVLSDAGGNAPTSGATIVLDDQASNHLPSNAALTSGTFQPTNFNTPDTLQFNPGGPFTPPSGSALGVFNGSNPNGAWTLHAFDDTGNGSTGFISGGWRLRIVSANGVPTANPDSFQAKAGKTLTVAAAGVLENDSDPDGDALIAILAGGPKKGSLDLESDGSFTYKAKKKARGKDSFTYLAEDASGLNSLTTVDIQVKAKKHKKRRK